MDIKSILLPTDFSDASKLSLMYAFDFIKVHRSKLYLMHVYEPMIQYTDVPMMMPDLYELDEHIQKNAVEAMEQIIENEIRPQERTLGKIEVEKVLVQGKPFLEIVRTAKELAIDLIIMASHGHGALEHILLGSVTEKVVRKAPCAVMTVRSTSNFSMPY